MDSKTSVESIKRAVKKAMQILADEESALRSGGDKSGQVAKKAVMRIALGADHGGFDLKEDLKTFLLQQGHEVKDCGTISREAVDYPAIAAEVAERVGSGACERGIMVDGAGIGSCVVANKIPGVRAAMCYDLSTARNSRQHNDTNVLTIGAGLIGAGLAQEIVRIWLETDCTEDRHLRRVAQIEQIERKYLSGKELKTAGFPEHDGSQMSVDALVEKITEHISAKITAPDLTQTIAAACDPCTGCGRCVEKKTDEVRRIIEAGAGRVSSSLGSTEISAQLAKFIDLTLLKPEASREQIDRLGQEAKKYEFATVCVNPTWVMRCRELLQDTPVKICTVVGFPLGATTTEAKAFEARRAIRDGAKEIDMVISVGALKSGDDELVRRDILAVTEACRDGSALSKVIIEAALLSDEEKVRACLLAREAKADFVKTSTGFGPGGATTHDVALMKEAVQCQLEIKAAGGIRTLAEAKKMLEAGATRIGASAGVRIIQEAEQLVAA
jgi:deoxyribose-phosphate aldolase